MLAVTGNQWRKHAPVQILALVAEYRERVDEQVVVLFQVLAAEINFGYKFQTVRLGLHPLAAMHRDACDDDDVCKKMHGNCCGDQTCLTCL